MIGTTEYDQHVIHMNEVHRFASGWVQRAPLKVACKIGESGHPAG
jgi:hypothetical protein